MSFNIEVEGGSSVRLPTAGKYCDRDIVITAIGGGGGSGENPLDYANKINSLWLSCNNIGIENFEVSFASKTKQKVDANAVYCAFYSASGFKTLKMHCGGIYDGGLSFQNTFRNNNEDRLLERIDISDWKNGVKPSTITGMCYNRSALKEISGEIDMTYCTNGGGHSSFDNNKSLETIRFKQGTISAPLDFLDCPKLTDETIQNIIDGLADLTGKTAQTLTLHATVGAKLTDAQKASASAKNWTISY